MGYVIASCNCPCYCIGTYDLQPRVFQVVTISNSFLACPSIGNLCPVQLNQVLVFPVFVASSDPD